VTTGWVPCSLHSTTSRFDTTWRDSFDDLRRQPLGDLLGLVAQPQYAAAAAVVWVAAGDVADGGLGLDRHELGEVIDGVQGAGSVADLPDHHCGDLDRDISPVPTEQLYRARLTGTPGSTWMAGRVRY
jgi:hypothetical protein